MSGPKPQSYFWRCRLGPSSVRWPSPNHLNLGQCPNRLFFVGCCPNHLWRSVWAVTRVAVYLVPVRSFQSACLSVGRWTRRSVSVGGTLPKKSSVAVCLGRYSSGCLSCAGTEFPSGCLSVGRRPRSCPSVGRWARRSSSVGGTLPKKLSLFGRSPLFVSVGSCPSINFFSWSLTLISSVRWLLPLNRLSVVSLTVVYCLSESVGHCPSPHTHPSYIHLLSPLDAYNCHSNHTHTCLTFDITP
jgi:hypothetical protein